MSDTLTELRHAARRLTDVQRGLVKSGQEDLVLACIELKQFVLRRYEDFGGVWKDGERQS